MGYIEFSIVRGFGVITTNASGWRRELNLVSWNGAEPKVDIRDWSPDHTKMGKGITLTPTEAEELYGLLTEAFADGSWQ